LSDLKLYELTDALRRLLDEVADGDGEMTPEQLAFEAGLKENLELKVEAVCKVRQERLVQAFAIGDEIRRLQDRKRALENGADRLKDYLKAQLAVIEETSVRTPLFSVRVQKSPARARWTREPDQIPDALARVVPAHRELDVKVVMQLRRDGIPLPDGVEITQGEHIVIQ
jgi:hypothetical protein